MEIRFTEEMLAMNIRLIEEKLRGSTDEGSREFTELMAVLAELRRAQSEISNDFGWISAE